MRIPEKVIKILKKFNDNGYQAFIVGGCVRDLLIGKEPEDWDILTNAGIDSMYGLFSKVIQVGLKHRTVLLIEGKERYEISVFEGNDKQAVIENLMKRDFTINAMAYSLEEGIIDPANGMADLKERIIRSTRAPDKRFQEDGLRMMRAIRFSVKYNFKIEENTFKAIMKNCELVSTICVERIRDELTKILTSPFPAHGIKLLDETGILDIIIPDFKSSKGFLQNHPRHDKDVFNHILAVLENTPEDLELRLAALFHDIAKPECYTWDDTKKIGRFLQHNEKSAEKTEIILHQLKYDNKTINNVKKLILEHDHKFPTEKSIKNLIKRTNPELSIKLMELKKADIMGQKPPYTEKLREMDEMKKLLESVIQKKL